MNTSPCAIFFSPFPSHVQYSNPVHDDSNNGTTAELGGNYKVLRKMLALLVLR